MAKRTMTDAGKAGVARGAKKTAIRKLLDKISTIDLSIFDSEIADLELKLAEVRGVRDRLAGLRGELAPPAAAKNGSKIPEATIDWSVEQVRVKIHEILDDEGGALELVALAKRSHIPAAVIQKALADDEQVLYGRWGYKLNQ